MTLSVVQASLKLAVLAQAGLGLMTFLMDHPECGYRQVPLCPALEYESCI